MKLEQTSLAVRERSQAEVQDLAFLFMKQNYRLMLVLYGCLGLPLAIFLTWSGRRNLPLFLYCVFVAIYYVGIRCLTAPFLGRALFETDGKKGPAFIRGPTRWRCLAQLVLDIVLAVPVVGLVWMAARRYFVPQVVALENVPDSAFAKRSRALHQQSYVGAAVRNFLFGVLIVVSVYLTSAALVALLTGSVTISPDPYVFVQQFIFWFAVTVAMFYCYTVHFLYYINHRTTHEGWDLYLQARRCVRENQLP